MSLRSTRRWLIVLTISAVPVAFALESALRALLLPPEFLEIRELLAPTMTTVGWIVLGLGGSLGAACLLLQPTLVRRAVGRLPSGANVDVAERARLGVYVIVASLTQGPALLSSFAYLLGSAVLPVLLAIAWSTIAVAVQALRIDVARIDE